MNNKINKKKVIHLIVVGGNRLNEDEPILSTIKLTRKYNIKLTLITEKIHLLKKCKSFLNLKKLLIKYKQKYLTLKNINKEFNKIEILLNKNEKNILLSLNSIWIIDEKILNFFKKRIFNLHIGTLPTQKGAGGASWLIMNNKYSSCATLHELSKVIDNGNIIYEECFKLKKDYTIIDYYKKVNYYEKKIIERFIKNIKEKKYFKTKVQNPNKSIYMPILNTKTHGFIDWSWNAKEIYNFIRAFDNPHMGASTFIKSKKYYLKSVNLIKTDTNFHPYQSGIIFRKSNSKIFIAAKKGALIIKKIYDSNNNILDFNDIKIGSRFYTPLKILDQSKINKVLHTGEGIKIKK